MWGGRGEGQSCDCCQNTLSPSDIMYELEYKSTGRTLRMHLQCYQLWQEEAASLQRRRVERGNACAADTSPADTHTADAHAHTARD